jgi:hypothetical protein
MNLNNSDDELHSSARNVDVYQEPLWHWALWWLMIALVGGFIIGILSISILG